MSEKKVATNSKTKAFKFDRLLSDFWEKSWKYYVISYLTYVILSWTPTFNIITLKYSIG
jgi:hypothetical protein